MAKKQSKSYYVLDENKLVTKFGVGRLSRSHWMDKFVHYATRFKPDLNTAHIDWSKASKMHRSGMHHADAAREYVGGISKETQTALFRRKEIVTPAKKLRADLLAAAMKKKKTPIKESVKRKHHYKKHADPLNPHGSLHSQEERLDSWRKRNQNKVFAGLAIGSALLGASEYYDRTHGNVATEGMKVITYKPFMREDAAVDAKNVSTSKKNKELKSTNDDSSSMPSKKKSSSSSSSKTTTIVYKKEKNHHDPEFEVPKKDLKPTGRDAYQGEPTTDDPETDARRDDSDQADQETAAHKLPHKAHAHFSDKASDSTHDDGEDKKSFSDEDGGKASKKKDDNGEEEDSSSTNNTRNGEDYKNLPDEHKLKKDPETGDPILDDEEEGKSQDEEDGAEAGSTGQDGSKEEEEGAASDDGAKKKKLSPKAQKIKDIYNKARSSSSKDGSEDDDQNDELNDDEVERDNEFNGNNRDDGQVLDPQGNLVDDPESTEDEPEGEVEKINFRPTMDSITTQGNIQ